MIARYILIYLFQIIDFNIYNLILIINMMRSLLKLRLPFSSKKLGIADTAKVIQDKIMNITQVVSV
jgi:hypothetical protein